MGISAKLFASLFLSLTTGLGIPVVTAISGESQVLINWEPPTSAINGVDIEESDDSGNTWSTVVKLPPTSTHYRVQGLIDGKNYWFRVKWIWPDDSLGIPSETLVAIPFNHPDVPTGLTATSNGLQIALNWDTNITESIIGYEIEQSIDSGQTWKILTANSGSPASQYLVTDLTPGVTYTYRIKALSFGGGESAYSDSTTVKSESVPAGGFALHYSISHSKVTLSWDTPIDLPYVQGYEIDASGDGGLNWFKVATTSADVTTAQVPYVIGGSAYQVIATSYSGLTSTSAIELVQTNEIANPFSATTVQQSFSPSSSGPGSRLSEANTRSTGGSTSTTQPGGNKTLSLYIIIAIIVLVLTLVSVIANNLSMRKRRRNSARKRSARVRTV